ncbi:hypothetical protein METSCH_A05200 [Metschnikowia aff. pulcherrima]|uniref:Uncharacterized protein n=1 Tax=Metschnikowia aff. pulcherrima TaxID=2163413 RepID=A0A4P6XGX6_9ASCO|nr:hypothetical protein METSCH_A05200 [Metschnikowia aff. pulcherrima]
MYYPERLAIYRRKRIHEVSNHDSTRFQTKLSPKSYYLDVFRSCSMSKKAHVRSPSAKRRVLMSAPFSKKMQKWCSFKFIPI